MPRTVTLTLTRPEATHLLYLLHDNEREGWYYGNKAQWQARHTRIAAKLAATEEEPCLEKS